MDAEVIVAASSRDMNLYYLTRFVAGDPFIFIRTRESDRRDGESDRRNGESGGGGAGRTYMVVTDLEKGRAAEQARVDEILSYPEFAGRCRQKGIAEPQIEHVLNEALRALGAQRIAVPYDFPLRIGDTLREAGFEVIPHAAGLPFVPERVVKTEEEIAHMRRAMEANEAAVAGAVEMIAASGISDGMLHDAEGPLTSERVKKRIARDLFENGYIASQTIVAAGDQGCNPHNAGTGRLPAHTPIIIDVFPRSKRTRYCADITRTVVRGKASDRVRRMFDAVLAAQHLVFDSLADGVDGGAVHRLVEELFNERGFKTGPNPDGRMEGFFHGTGHGLGLEIHELPRFNRSRSIFRAGMVVTVEPGLYYPGTGGVRLEDAVVIRERGCENLCTLEKRLEI